MATAQQKYDAKSKELTDKMNAVSSKAAHTKGKARRLHQKKLNRLQNELNKLDSGNSSGSQANRQTDYAQATKSNIQSDDDYESFSYLRANNPRSTHSYVYLFIQNEAPTFSNNVSNEATEAGVNRMTNSQMQPTSVNLSGIIYNKSDGLEPVKKIVDKISGWVNSGTEMCYSGTQFYRRCIITSFNPTFNTNGDGSTNTASFSMDIQAAMYFDSEMQQSSKSVKHTGSKGRQKGSETGRKYVVAKRGDSYGRIARKKGVSLSTVKSMNSGTLSEGKRIYY